MARISSIRAEDVRVGDVLTVVSQHIGLLYNEVTVNRVKPTGIFVSHEDDSIDGFSRDGFSRDGYWKFYLVDRPKPKLPTKLGSVIKAGEELWVLCDPEDSLSWRTAGGQWQDNDFFDHVDWELVD